MIVRTVLAADRIEVAVRTPLWQQADRIENDLQPELERTKEHLVVARTEVAGTVEVVAVHTAVAAAVVDHS